MLFNGQSTVSNLIISLEALVKTEDVLCLLSICCRVKSFPRKQGLSKLPKQIFCENLVTVLPVSSLRQGWGITFTQLKQTTLIPIGRYCPTNTIQANPYKSRGSGHPVDPSV